MVGSFHYIGMHFVSMMVSTPIKFHSGMQTEAIDISKRHLQVRRELVV